MSQKFNESDVTRNATGKFTGRTSREPAFSLAGILKKQAAPERIAVNGLPGKSHEELQASAMRTRDRGQAAAARSVLGAYPEIVSVEFVDVDRTSGEAGPGQHPFEIRNVRLADGSIASEENPPLYNLAGDDLRSDGDYEDHLYAAFNPEDGRGNRNESFYKDHLGKGPVDLQDLIDKDTPRPLVLNGWGEYIDTDARAYVEDVTDEERASLGARTPEAAIEEHADDLIREHGKEQAIKIIDTDRRMAPGRNGLKELQAALASRPDRKPSWNPFRRR